VPVVQAVDAANTVDTDYSTAMVLSATNTSGGAVAGTVNSLAGTGDTDLADTTVTLTPSSGAATFTGLALTYTNDSSPSNSIALHASSGSLTAANSSTLTSTTNPTVTITSSAATVKAGDTATITFTFSEAPTGFADEDITISGGTLSTVTMDSGDNKIYTATFTPTAAVNSLSGSILVAANKFTNASMLDNVASNTLVISGDTARPTLASAITISDTALKIGDLPTVTFTFTEAVTGFAVGDVTVPNGALTSLSSVDGGIYLDGHLNPQCQHHSSNKRSDFGLHRRG